MKPAAVALTVAVSGSLALLSAQATVPAQSPPAFEVASVKPNTSGATAQSGRISNGSAVFTNMRMRALVTTAYGVRPDRIVRTPAWFDQERFDITARAPLDTPDSQLRLMLRTLLEERFRLIVRAETREQPVYALVLARANRSLGPNLRPSSECEANRGGVGTAAAGPARATLPGPQSCTVFTGNRGPEGYITGGARPIEALVQALQGAGLRELIDRAVVDRTGLTGTYDFDLRFAAASLNAAPADVPVLPSIFTALQEQLGLRLEPARGPVDVLVVDSVERPTPD